MGTNCSISVYHFMKMTSFVVNITQQGLIPKRAPISHILKLTSVSVDDQTHLVYYIFTILVQKLFYLAWMIWVIVLCFLKSVTCGIA